MKGKVIMYIIGVVSFITSSAFGKTASNKNKMLLGLSVNSSNIGLTYSTQNRNLENRIGFGVTAGYMYKIDRNSIVLDGGMDFLIEKSHNNKTDYGFFLALKYGFDILDNMKAYTGLSFNQRKYDYFYGRLGYTDRKSNVHLAVLIGAESKIKENIGFFGEINYFIYGGKLIGKEATERKNRGNMIKIGARYYF